MPSLDQTKILPYSAEKIYDLVMDIEQYPEFLPWCKKAKIIDVIADDNLQADLLINFKSFFEKYRSDVKHSKDSAGDYYVEVVAIQGPFKKLINKWHFHPLDDSTCEVRFFIDFEFNSFLLTKMIGGIFSRAVEKMMKAFEERAQEKFG